MSIPLPSAQCKDVGTAAALRAAISGIASCLPDATEVQTLANSVTVCSSFYTIFLTWIAVVWKAICYVFASIGTSGDALQEEIDALEEDVADLQAITATLPAVPHVGTPTITAGAAAGGSPTITLLAGSTDVQGAVDVTLGSAPTAAGGNMFTINFGTNFANYIFPVASSKAAGALASAGLLVNTFETSTPPVTGMAIIVHSPTAAFLAAQTFRVSYQVGYTS